MQTPGPHGLGLWMGDIGGLWSTLVHLLPGGHHGPKICIRNSPLREAVCVYRLSAVFVVILTGGLHSSDTSCR